MRYPEIARIKTLETFLHYMLIRSSQRILNPIRYTDILVNQGARELVHGMVIDENGLVCVDWDHNIFLLRYGVRGKKNKGKTIIRLNQGINS